jgi:sporulation protein YlmC with PRC-barrel domain
MKKVLILLPVIGMLSIGFGFIAPDIYAGGMRSQGLGGPIEMSALTGTHVKNLYGDYLGKIGDFVLDHEGRIAFAIIAHGGFLGIGEKSVAIPFHTLRYDQKERFFTVDISKERFASAPTFDRHMLSRTWAEDAYRYFGLQPYWTEGAWELPAMKEFEEERGMRNFPEEFPLSEHMYWGP